MGLHRWRRLRVSLGGLLLLGGIFSARRGDFVANRAVVVCGKIGVHHLPVYRNSHGTFGGYSPRT